MFFVKKKISTFGSRAETLITRSAQCHTAAFVYIMLEVAVYGLFHRERQRAVCVLSSNATSYEMFQKENRLEFLYTYIYTLFTYSVTLLA